MSGGSNRVCNNCHNDEYFNQRIHSKPKNIITSISNMNGIDLKILTNNMINLLKILHIQILKQKEEKDVLSQKVETLQKQSHIVYENSSTKQVKGI